MLADEVDFVVGVDTHRDSHTAVIVNPAGAEQAQLTVPTDPRGYRRLLDFAEHAARGRRCWAIEGTGSFGAGLTALLRDHASRSSRSTAPSDRCGAMGPSPTHWTPLERRARRCRVSILPSRASAAGAKPSECC